jgi:hypothetical protein
VALDLEPTGFEFATGSRVRLTIACADAGNFDTPILDASPEIELLHDTQHPSRMDIPTIAQPRT